MNCLAEKIFPMLDTYTDTKGSTCALSEQAYWQKSLRAGEVSET